MSQARSRKKSFSCRGIAYGWKELGTLVELKEVLVGPRELWEDWGEMRLEVSSGIRLGRAL